MHINVATFLSPALHVTPVSVEWSDFYWIIIGSYLPSVTEDFKYRNKDWNLNIQSTTLTKKDHDICILEAWFKVCVWNAVIISFFFWWLIVFSLYRLVCVCVILTAYVAFTFRSDNLRNFLLPWVASQPEFQELGCWTNNIRYEILEYIFLSGIMQHLIDNS